MEMTDLDATTRFRSRWSSEIFFRFLTSRAPPQEMKGRVYTSCVRSSMTYGGETRPLLDYVGLKFERAEMYIDIICQVMYFLVDSQVYMLCTNKDYYYINDNYWNYRISEVLWWSVCGYLINTDRRIHRNITARVRFAHSLQRDTSTIECLCKIK